MKALIKQFNVKNEYYTSEKCFITEISNSTDDPDLSIAQARVEAGITTCWHRVKNTVERYYILSGEGLMELGDTAPQPVRSGDVVIIPPLCKQRITNTGNSDLVFLAICSPRFLQNNYQEIE